MLDARFAMLRFDGAVRRLLVLGSCCTRSPVVITSSLTDESDDDEGCEEISTHESRL